MMKSVLEVLLTAFFLILTCNAHTAEPFTMIIASDPQLPWWRGDHDPNCNGDDCVNQQAAINNINQVDAMNNITKTKSYSGSSASVGVWPNVPNLTVGAGTGIKEPLGVIMNGDLTAFWHNWQFDMYRKYYDPGYSDADEKVLQLNIFPGLGNHDYQNNVGDCGWPDTNACAKKAVAYIKNMINYECWSHR